MSITNEDQTVERRATYEIEYSSILELSPCSHTLQIIISEDDDNLDIINKALYGSSNLMPGEDGYLEGILTVANKKEPPIKVEVIVLNKGMKLSEINLTGDPATKIILATAVLNNQTTNYTPDRTKCRKIPLWIDNGVDIDGQYFINGNVVAKNGKAKGDGVRKDLVGVIVSDADRRFASVLPTSWYKNFKKNPFTRTFPTSGGSPAQIEGLSLVISPSDEERKRIDAVLNEARKTGRLEIVIPTCPFDSAYWIESLRQTKYLPTTTEDPEGKLTWTHMNTLDALRVVLPMLKAQGITPRITFATGDYEGYAGYTRGKTIDQFIGDLNITQRTIANHAQAILKSIWPGEYNVVEEQSQDESNACKTNVIKISSSNGEPEIIVQGITRFIQGGFNTWNEKMLPDAAQVFRNRYEHDPKFRSLVDEAFENRKQMIMFWLMQKNLPTTEELIREEFMKDMANYVALHTFAMAISRNGLVITGDASSIEKIGSEVLQSATLRVEGGYIGGN